MFAFTLLPFALAATAFALPTARQASSCASLGASAMSNAYNFTLAAFNSSSTTAIPLVVRQEMEDSAGEVGICVLATKSQYTAGDLFPDLSLVNGTLIPNQPNSPAVDMPVTAGQALTFEYTQDALRQYLPAAAPDYCAVPVADDGYGGALLYANGDASSFFACPDQHYLNSIVYKPSADNGGVYDYTSCWPVTIRLQ
ncbi:hypothetical protein B0H21DRAFT_826286 [Amylocystis lapponica]|nr:hypothetical protein B0H21DRAFT_826286 [Amylocystis lapponica]